MANDYFYIIAPGSPGSGDKEKLATEKSVTKVSDDLKTLKEKVDKAPAQLVAPNIASRPAIAEAGTIVHVIDASADITVSAGWAKYEMVNGAWEIYAAQEEMGVKRASVTKVEDDLKVLEEKVKKLPEQLVVANVAERPAVAEAGTIVHVIDASADVTVTAGWAKYEMINGAWEIYATQEGMKATVLTLSETMDRTSKKDGEVSGQKLFHALTKIGITEYDPTLIGYGTGNIKYVMHEGLIYRAKAPAIDAGVVPGADETKWEAVVTDRPTRFFENMADAEAQEMEIGQIFAVRGEGAWVNNGAVKVLFDKSTPLIESLLSAKLKVQTIIDTAVDIPAKSEFGTYVLVAKVTNATANLPKAADAKGETYAIKVGELIDPSKAYLAPAAGEAIDGTVGTIELSKTNDSITVISDGLEWKILSRIQATEIEKEGTPVDTTGLENGDLLKYDKVNKKLVKQDTGEIWVQQALGTWAGQKTFSDGGQVAVNLDRPDLADKITFTFQASNGEMFSETTNFLGGSGAYKMLASPYDTRYVTVEIVSRTSNTLYFKIWDGNIDVRITRVDAYRNYKMKILA